VARQSIRPVGYDSPEGGRQTGIAATNDPSIRQLRIHKLTTIGSILEGMDVDGDFVAWLDSVCPPAAASESARPAHLNTPFNWFALGVGCDHVEPTMRIDELEFPDRAVDG
jgi:hypothetical protein